MKCHQLSRFFVWSIAASARVASAGQLAPIPLTDPPDDPATVPADREADPGEPAPPQPPPREPADPPTSVDGRGSGPGETRSNDPGPAEVIEVTGTAPASAGTISVDADVARRAPGALGEPLRVLALLPGVTTSIAASGYPIIRGTLPGEARFAFDGIELPMLYHLLLGNQTIHPSFIGDLELRAGGAGAEQGHLLGGLITMTPATPDRARSELRASLVELGAYRFAPLSKATSLAAAARVGTLAAAAKIYDASASLHYLDQQTRLVHRLGNGDRLTLTSLAAYDYAQLPPDFVRRTLQIGFHRLDGRWSRATRRGKLRAGLQTEIDSFRYVLEFLETEGLPPGTVIPPRRRGGRSYGMRAYTDGELRLAPWLVVRGGLEAHRRTRINREPLIDLTRGDDPFLGEARMVDREGAWAALDLHIGRLTITPGVRAESHHADMPALSVRHAAVDPRLAISAELPNGAHLELAGGVYTAPPQVSIVESSILIGPLPVSDGTASSSGLSQGFQAQASLRTPLPAGLQGSFATYYRDTSYAVDFAMVGKQVINAPPCAAVLPSARAYFYRHVGVRALGVEAMVRRQIGRSVTGWVSYSLGKVDRDLGFAQLPHDYDQRHTLNATAQWRLGTWVLGGTGHLHTGRPVIYPEVTACNPEEAAGAFVSVVRDLTRLRRLPTNWRIDLRAERSFVGWGWNMRVYFELQNASFTKEIVDYDAVSGDDPFDGSGYHVVEKSLFLPVPSIGIEADL